jgi:enoyl-CoA hydratase/carnithine racemase
MSERKYILTSAEDNIFIITVDHTPINTLDTQTLSELEEALDEFTANSIYKVAIISGGDKVIFVSGADISEAVELFASGKIKDFILRGQRLFRKISECPKPVLAAINGLALGGGMELAMACHLRVMGDLAKLAQPEINLGIIPGWGGTQMLPKIVGNAKAREMILTGESISAQEAYRLNLVNMVVPRSEVMNTSKKLARKIAGKSSLAIRAAMDSIRMGSQLQAEDGLAYEANQIIPLIGSEDAREGLTAFLEKRPPIFKDK